MKQYIITLVLAVLAALAVRHLVLTAYRVPTGSMQPALKPGDFIFALRTAYGVRLPFMAQSWGSRSPDRGDLVVFSYPNQPGVAYVKRVIALPGDRVQIVGHRLKLNEVPLVYSPMEGKPGDNPNPEMFDLLEEKMGESSWAIIVEKGGGDHSFGPLVVPPGEVFLLGDNRDTSDDSRYWGTVPLPQISGRVVSIWLSLDWQNRWADGRFPRVRWNRVFTAVH